MLKVNDMELKEGLEVILPEEWHENAMTFGKLENCPYEFVVEELVKTNANKETYYVCKSKKKEKEVRIAFTKMALMYLNGSEVPDKNVGLHFKEFLPLENTYILITSLRNPSEVVPGIFKMNTELIEIEEKSIICINFKIDFTNGNGFSSVRVFCEGYRKATWKFLFNEDISCMTEYEQMFQDTMIHKSYVLKSCEKLAYYLEREGAVEHANLLLQRAKTHDDTKITCEDEMHALARIIHDKSSLKDSSKQLSATKIDSLKLHWKHNTHHPEHFKSATDMSKLDIMEMCCDWHARSTQYKTNFLEFVKKRQEERFHFPEWMFAEIWHYCEILAYDV